ncbi:MAG: sugar phosphate isomerase/epimerase [Candidatus Lokiarchaeota archaeon]|nr:sugar phosphate isomerase/epimerase [Candidatus Lokiarchaeota archaeon]
MALEEDVLFKPGPFPTERALLDAMLDWVRKSLEFGEENAFDFVELIIESPLIDGDGSLAELRAAIDSFKIPVNFHAPFIDNNIIDFDYQIREGSIREYEIAIDLARSLKRPPSTITIHPGRMQPFLLPIWGALRGTYFEQAMRRLGARERPATTSLCVEQLPATSNFFNKIDDIVAFAAKDYFKQFRLTLDTSHMWMCEDMAGFDRYFKELGPSIVNMHFVDNKTKANDPHVPVGKGVIDFAEVARCMKAYNYDRDVTIEHGGPADVLQARDFIRNLLG